MTNQVLAAGGANTAGVNRAKINENFLELYTSEFGIFADSVSGNNANDGLTVTTAKQTIAAAIALVPYGGRLSLARGSIFRESMDLRSLGPVTVESYGSGNLPIVDGSQVASGFASYSGIVYSFTATLPLGTTNRSYPFLFEDGVRLKEVVDGDGADLAARIALVQANPGSFYFGGPGTFSAGWAAGVKTYYFSASDSSNPTSSGKVYECNNLSFTIQADNATLRDLHTRRMTHHDGLTCGNTLGGLLERVQVSDYSRHGIIDGRSVHRECIVSGGNPRFPGGAFHFYKAANSEFDARYHKCKAYGTTYLGARQGSGYFGHGPTAGAARVGDRVLIEDCYAEGLATGFGGSDTDFLDLIRCETNYCDTDVSSAPRKTLTIEDCNFKGASLAGIGVNIAGRSTIIRRCKLVTSLTSDNAAMIWSGSTMGSVSIEDCELVNVGQWQPNARQPIRCTGAIDRLAISNTAIIAYNGTFLDLVSAVSVTTWSIPDDSLITSLPLSALINASRVATTTLTGVGVIQSIRPSRFYRQPPIFGSFAKQLGSNWPVSEGFNTIVFNKGSGSFVDWIIGAKSQVALITSTALEGRSGVFTPTAELLGGFLVASPRTFHLVGRTGRIARSTSTSSGWAEVTSGTSEDLFGGAATTGTCVAVGATGTILRSTNDGAAWSPAVTPAAGVNNLRSAAFGASVFVAVGAAGTIVSSSNGDTWTARTSGTANLLRSVVFGSSIFVAVGDGGVIRTSTDGTTWTTRTSGTIRNFISVDQGGGRFVAICEDNTQQPGDIFSSTDGITWTPVAFELPFVPTAVLYGGASNTEFWWMIIGRSDSIAISFDSLSWRIKTAFRPNLAKMRLLK